MKKSFTLWKETLQEVRNISKKEYLLTLSVCLLFGLVAGMLFSPKKKMIIGSFNSNAELPDGCCCGDDDDDDYYDCEDELKF